MKTYFPLIAVAVITGCNANEPTAGKAIAKADTAALQRNTATAQPAATETAGVTFKVNDTLARTAKNTHTNDRDEHIGIYTEATKFLSFSVMGDVPGRPHRGWLQVGITGFKFEPAIYTVTKDNHASFTRYETENAGLATEFSASSNAVDKGTEFTFTITKLENDPASLNGRDWLATGTFSAKMLLKEANPFKRASAAGLIISEGSFEKIRIAGGPRLQ